ncbi:MAG: hypothetical protein GXO68_01245 [Crenarchaeota archaeon]|nr:hypothetical protein [Thermoproteota archaeon]
MWWRKKFLRALQFNIEDPYGFFADKIDANTLVSLAKRVHANVLIVFARDGWGRVFYEGSRLYPRHHNSALDLRELVSKAKDNGIHVIVMAAHTANRYIYRLHPNWAQRDIKGEVLVLEHYPRAAKIIDPHWPQICPNSPALEQFFIPEVEEAVKLTGADGLLLDSFRYFPDPQRACFCQYCKTKFKSEYGEELPHRIDMEEEAARHAWEWRYKVNLRAIERMRKAVKRANPEALYLYNSHPAGWAGRGNIVVAKARKILDGVFAEASEVDIRGPGMLTIITKLSKALLGDPNKPVFVSRNLFYDLRPVHSPPDPTIRLGVWEIVAAGGYPQATIFSSQFFTDPRAVDAVADVYEELEKIEDYLVEREPLYYVGLLFDPETHDKYYWSKPEYYIGEVEGFALMLMHNHIPWSIVSMQDIEREAEPNKYPILVAAGTSVVSEDSEEKLRGYIAEGGLLVATHEFGIMRPDFTYREALALQDIFGVNYEGTLRFGFAYIHLSVPEVKDLWNGLPESVPIGDHSVVFARERVEPRLGELARARLTSAKPLAYARMGRSGYGYEYTLGKSTPAPDSVLSLAAISYNEYGNGKTLYYSFRLGAHYSRLGIPDYAHLFLRPLLKYAPQPPVRLIGSETVQLEAYRKDDSIIVHLVNHTTNQRILSAPTGPSKQSPPGFDPAYRVHPTRVIVPVRDLTLEVSRDVFGDKLRAWNPLTGEEYSYTTEGDWIRVSIPVVEDHVIVVIEPRS